MKREFPTLYKLVSTAIGMPLVGLTTLIYLQKGVEEPASTAFPVGITAVGITLGLAAACFTMSPIGENTQGQYAGEKFLHSSILLTQSLFILYARDALTELDWIKSNSAILTTIKFVANTVLLWMTATAGWCWYFGLSRLNEVLWQNWKQRTEEINQSDKSCTQSGQLVTEIPDVHAPKKCVPEK